MEGFDSVPSPLEAPLYGDAPKREWLDGFGATLGVGAAWPFGPDDRRAPRPLEERADAPWPTRATDADPISIELVRGADGVANGGADRWSLVIDGTRCDWVAEPGESSSCFLPSPFADAIVDNIAYLTPEDVRPLVIGVRLEAEALEPARVELIVEQAVAHDGDNGDDDARAGDDDLPDAEEVVALAAQELKPYRPGDTVAHALAMPYLWCAPAQSTLGIANFAAATAYEDRVAQAAALNKAIAEAAENKNPAAEAKLRERQKRKKTIDLQNQLIRERNAAMERDWREAQAAAAALEATVGTLEATAGAQALRDYREPPRPTRERPVPELTDEQQAAVTARLEDLPPIPQTGGAKKKVWTYGGGAQSAAAALTGTVRVLTKTSEAVRANPPSSDGSAAANFTPFCAHVRAMRNWLREGHQDKALALLDALLTSTPSPLALVLAKDYFALNKETTGVELSDAQTGEGEQEKTRWRKSEKYEFVYERMHHKVLAQSTTRLRLRLRIHSRNGTAPAEVLIRAPQQYAIAAGVAYRRGDDDFLNLTAALSELERTSGGRSTTRVPAGRRRRRARGAREHRRHVERRLQRRRLDPGGQQHCAQPVRSLHDGGAGRRPSNPRPTAHPKRKPRRRRSGLSSVQKDQHQWEELRPCAAIHAAARATQASADAPPAARPRGAIAAAANDARRQRADGARGRRGPEHEDAQPSGRVLVRAPVGSFDSIWGRLLCEPRGGHCCCGGRSTGGANGNSGLRARLRLFPGCQLVRRFRPAAHSAKARRVHAASAYETR